MDKVYYRVDDRLIHGQVVTAWAREYDLEQVLIIDDGAASDPLFRQIIAATAPSGIKVKVLTVATAADEVQAARSGEKPTLVLVKGPAPLLALQERGIPIREVVFGGMQFRPGRKQVTRTISLGPEEELQCRALARNGTALVVQVVPTDRRQDLLPLLGAEP